MKEKYLNIDNLLILKIYADDYAINNIKKRFTNLTYNNFVCDYEIVYKNNSNINKLDLKEEMIPFRNSIYSVSKFNNNVIAYSKEQKYSCDNLIIRNDKKINVYCSHDINNKILIRLITELLVRKLLEKGFFPLHASSTVTNNVSTLYVGGKKSGKSTALLNDILFSDANPQANDITFVGKDNKNWISFGIPYDFTFDKSLLCDLNISYQKNNKVIFESDKPRFDVLDFCNQFNKKWIWSSIISNINIVNLNKYNKYILKKNISQYESIKYLKSFEKENKFTFDDFLMINNLIPNYKYKELVKDIQFNKIEGNIISRR